MDVKLCLVKGNPKGKEVHVAPGTVKVGRAEDSDVIIASTRVSRQHCLITNDNEKVVISDLGSKNGCFVNGARITEQDLKPGDQVQIGSLTFVVEIDGDRGSSSAAESPTPVAQEPADELLMPESGGKASESDILAGLERLAGTQGPASDDTTIAPPDEDEDLLKLSDDDLVD